jgi:tripeptidyl-peptidase I
MVSQLPIPITASGRKCPITPDPLAIPVVFVIYCLVSTPILHTPTWTTMYWLSVLSVLAAVSLGLSIPTWEDMRLKHSWDSIPKNWEYQGHPPVGTTIDLRIAFKPHRENALIDALYEVSDPRHSRYVSIPLFSLCIYSHLRMYIQYCRYGAHLSQEQVAELVAPHPDTLELVGSWLAFHEVPSASVSITHGGGWLTVYNVSMAQANALLGATYQRYQHIETNETIIRTIGYALPAVLHMHVQTVAPTTYFGSPRALRLNSKVMSNGPTLPNGDHELQNASATSPLDAPLPSTCSVTITPECLRQLYNTLSYKPQAPSSNSLGVTGYLDQFASHSDLTEFLSLFRIDALSAQFPVVRVNGGLDDQNQPGVEVSPVLHVRVYVM